ncbi:MAG: alpha/beta hydrolase [Candidatus Sericytochromatia bacterium]
MKKISIIATLLVLASCSNNLSLDNELSDLSNASAVNKNFISWTANEKDWGKHSQIAATYEELNDIKGNSDGIWDNEKDKAGTVNNIGVSLPLKPLFEKGEKLLQAELSPTNIVKKLNEFKISKESEWGRPVTNLNLNDIKQGQLFSIQKAIYLTRFKRTPNQVTEGFLSASGTINDVSIPTREIFWQRFKPVSKANGKIAVISPGFLESGRNFYEQADKLNKYGYDVIIMDHQWAGYTKGGKPGLADRGFGVTRDVASVTAFAQSILEKEYSSYSQKEVLIIGNSMGAGPGALAAITLNDNNKIKLDGYKMPQGVNVILQAPFLGSTENIINSALSVFAKVPFAKNIQLYNIGVPILTHNKVAAQKAMQISLLEDTRAQANTMISSNKDIDVVLNLIKSGVYPKGKVSIVHADRDPLADSKKSILLSEYMPKDRFSLQVISSNNHVFEQSPEEQDLAINATLRI